MPQPTLFRQIARTAPRLPVEVGEMPGATACTLLSADSLGKMLIDVEEELPEADIMQQIMKHN
jgi:hypothetical protein